MSILCLSDFGFRKERRLCELLCMQQLGTDKVSLTSEDVPWLKD